MTVEKPLVAMLFACLYGLSLAMAGRTEPILVVLVIPLIWLSVTDFCGQIIPDSAIAALVFWGTMSHGFSGSLMVNLAVAVAVLAVLWAASEIYWRRQGREALGLGDVKLISAAVLCVGATQIWLVVLIACLGGIAAIMISKLRGRAVEFGVPFGPFIAYGLFLTVLLSGTV